MPLHPINCLNCNVIFNVNTKEQKRGYGKFCSRACSGEYKTKTTLPKEPNVSCEICGKRFYSAVSKSKNSRSGLRFCSRRCKDNGQSLEYGLRSIWPDHYGSGTDNYREIAFKHHPHKCHDCGYNTVIEILEVHHVNHNREDNKKENLRILCPNCHRLTHHLKRKAIPLS